MPKHSDRNITRKSIYLLLAACLLLALLGNALHSRIFATQPTLNTTLTALPKNPIVTTSGPLVWPDNGQAAVGAFGYGVLASNGAQKPVPTASIAKLITILAILKVKPLTVGESGPILTLGPADVSIYQSYLANDGSVTVVTDGEQISQYQSIQAMLLPSSNNMADSLAIWAFGSLAAYSSYANQMLSQLGLIHTHVGNDASGFSPTTTSTASDLVKLGELAVANPVIAAIASQESAVIPVAGTIYNVNWLLGSRGINGLKTGNSDQAGGAYLFSANYEVAPKHNLTIIGAIMDAPSLQSAMDSAPPLLASAQKSFSYSPLIKAGQTVGVYQVPWASNVKAAASRSVYTLAWRGNNLLKPKVKLFSIKAPQNKGTIVGRVSNGSLPTDESGYSGVTLAAPVTSPSLWWRIFHS